MKTEEEIREQLKRIRNLYIESCEASLKFSANSQDRSQANYWVEHSKYMKRLDSESTMRSEMAILEWILDERQNWRTSWMME